MHVLLRFQWCCRWHTGHTSPWLGYNFSPQRGVQRHRALHDDVRDEMARPRSGGEHLWERGAERCELAGGLRQPFYGQRAQSRAPDSDSDAGLSLDAAAARGELGLTRTRARAREQRAAQDHERGGRHDGLGNVGEAVGADSDGGEIDGVQDERRGVPEEDREAGELG
ncbi:hypothetical protein GSI_09780 [Ganoderma sinense ZZ0214-1]|uniref:Uncharacterized protein n=1 Tax=Ganoderma sinense ZZ0214-1 TaxID=1077348 RepID=A0A2G8S2Y1_9APHY|nr:hypothetical protein GSI_09780 [Ganoderma sinense ZZ0214-1]